MRTELVQTLAEMYREWCRLKCYAQPKSPIEQMIDDATGIEKVRVKEFMDWIKNDIIPRMPML